MSKNKNYRVFYFIKLIRILKGLEIFNVQKMMATIGAAVQSRTRLRMEKDSSIGENVDEDNNSINMLTNIGYLLKIMKLITFIFNFSFFTATIWTVACDILNEKYLSYQDDPDDSFMQTFEIKDEPDRKKVLVTMYFIFTSLTTTGFGDFHPRSNSERLLSTVMLLIGVSIVSYAMTVFIDILTTYRSINDHIEDGDKLSKFFGMIARFNNGKKI